MRKYQQVALLVLAFVSVFGLILYRKQYMELRSTFESFSIFGGSEKPHECIVLNETVNVDEMKYYHSFPGWTYLSDSFYVYSAFWKGSGISKAVGIGPKGTTPVFECHLWQDFRDTLFSNEGSFNYNEIEVENSSYSVFEFSCDVGSLKILGSPYMFVFIKNKEKRFVPILENRKKTVVDSAAVCVHPDYTGVNKISIIEFISFHQELGFTDFVLYDDLHYGLLLKLKGVLSSLNWIKSFDVLPWHFPLGINDPSAKIVLNIDCSHRVSNRVSFITVLNFEDYIVPKANKRITEIFNSISHSGFLNFRYKTCCNNYKNDRQAEESWPTVVKKTNCFVNNQTKRTVINPPADTFKLVILDSLASVNTYKLCNEKEISKAMYDSSTKKFLGLLLRNKIIRLWNSGYFF